MAAATVLAIDDNATIRKAVSMRLGAKGFEVVTAADGDSALALLARRPFDLVLLDLVMPGMRGEEVLRRLRELYPPSELPIIMLAASGDAADIQRSLALGANDYVIKPGNLPTLVARIHTQLALRDNQARLRSRAVTAAPARRAAGTPAPTTGAGATAGEPLPYALLYDHLPATCFTVSAAGLILHVSGYGAACLGSRPDQVIGRPLVDLYPADDRGLCEAQIESALARPGWVHHWEARHRKDGGETAWMRNTARAVATAQGKLLLVTCEDIDDTYRLSERLAFQSQHDDLTGLANRKALEQRLQQVIESASAERTEHALAVIEIAEFKLINDTCGHAAGDDLLRHIARQVKATARKRDTVARIGGDEFAMLIEDCSATAARNAFKAVQRALAQHPFVWQSQLHHLSTGIGIAMIDHSCETPAQALNMADTACYAARDAGRNRMHVYQSDAAAVVLRQGEMRWASRFSRALTEDRFMLAVQRISPLTPAAQGLYCEMLVRMRDETGQVVMPGEFLPAAERYKLADKLDRWVIGHTFDWLRRGANPEGRATLCSINLSGQSIGNDGMLAYLLGEFDQGGVRPEQICFEITETAAVADLARATRFVHRLKERGCRFALDDFGSGYSSLSYLKQLPVDYLKIDGAFVRDMATHAIDYAMVRSINDIGHVMGKQTVAECVEDAATLERLIELGVDFAQGYAIERPRVLEDGA